MRLRILLACIGAACLVAAVSAQRFQAGVDAVRVEVFVRDGAASVSGLIAGDFELRDNGVPQAVELLKVDDLPVSAMLLLDTSNSVDGPALVNLKDAARAAVEALRPDDHAAVMTFASAVTLRRGWTKPSAEIYDAIAHAPQGGSTSLYDALFAALLLRDPEPGTRHLILLFSDGEDSASWLPRDAVTEAARRADSVVYTVTIRPPGAEVVLQYRSGVKLWSARQDARAMRPFAGRAAPAHWRVGTTTGGSQRTCRADAHTHEHHRRIPDGIRAWLHAAWSRRRRVARDCGHVEAEEGNGSGPQRLVRDFCGWPSEGLALDRTHRRLGSKGSMRQRVAMRKKKGHDGRSSPPWPPWPAMKRAGYLEGSGSRMPDSLKV